MAKSWSFDFDGEHHENAYDFCKDLIPTQNDFRANMFGHKPRSPIIADESSIYAFLACKNEYGSDTIAPYLIYRRAFSASCSSCWSWGMGHYPACPATADTDQVCLGGACDIFEEVKPEEIRAGIMLAQKRIKTGMPVSCGDIPVILLDMYGAYENGFKLTDSFFRKLAVFRKAAASCHLNQVGYQIISRADDHALMMLPTDPDTYDKYVLGALVELHEKISVVVGLACGSFYYWREDEIYSEAKNKLWASMKNLPSGTIYIDVSGVELSKRIGVRWDDRNLKNYTKE